MTCFTLFAKQWSLRVSSWLFIWLFLVILSLFFLNFVKAAGSVSVWQTKLVGLIDPPVWGPSPVRPGHLTIDDVDTAGSLILDIDASLITYNQPRKTLVTVHTSAPGEDVIESPKFETMVVDLIDKKEDFVFEVNQIAWTTDDACLVRLIDLDAPNDNNSFLIHSDYSIDASVDGKSFVLRTKVRNLWTIDEKVTLNATIRDYFGASYRSMPIEFTLPMHDELTLTMPMSVIPWYKMWFTVTLNVASTPENPLEDKLSGDLLRSQSISHVDTFFLFPRWLLWVVLGALIVLKILRKLSKNSSAHDRLKRSIERERSLQWIQ
jgi:hypothetical protein